MTSVDRCGSIQDKGRQLRLTHLLCCLSVWFWIAGGQNLSAQITGATIRGEVRDSSGLAVPAAQVTVTNDDTGLRRVFRTNEVGIYTVAELPIGGKA